jgi:hypothetical protein
MQTMESRQPATPLLIGFGCMGVLMPLIMSLFALWVLRLFVGTNIVAWWRDTFGDPVFRVVARAAIQTGGDTGATILLALVPFVAVLWILRTGQAMAARHSLLSMQSSHSLSQDLDAARDELRRIFSDDPEQIALYQARVSDPAVKKRRHPGSAVALGCLPSIVLGILLGPVTVFLNLAIFDSFLRLTGMFDASRTLSQSAGALAAALAPLVPLEPTAFGFVLADRSALLTLVVGAISVLTWLLTTMPRAVFMWPRGISRGSVLSFLIGLVLIYVIANALLLLLMTVLAGFNLVMMVALYVLRPLRLWAGGMWRRTRQGSLGVGG